MTNRTRIPCPKCQRPTRISATGTLRRHNEADSGTRCDGSGTQVVDLEAAEKPRGET